MENTILDKILTYFLYFAGSRGVIEEIEFHTGFGVYDWSSLWGFLGPGSQGRVEAAGQEFVGCASPMVEPVCT